jgi:hypothetical protein
MKRIIKKEFSFHGKRTKKGYFEGWYYKVTSESYSIAIIVGINKNTADDHGFIQTLDTVSGIEQYIRFPLHEVRITNDPFHIEMGDNHFYMDSIKVCIKDPISINMHIQLGDFHYLDSSFFAPTIMGPFSYIPRMECVHTIHSLHHKVIGKIEVDKQDLSVYNAIGYIEKDRGTSFPTTYLWLQSNHFHNQKKASLFLSIASIPLYVLDFTGIIMVFMFGSQQLRFGSYYGAKVKVIKKIDNNGYKIIMEQGTYRICIKIYLGKVFTLSAPSMGEMKHKAYETLSAKGLIHVYKNNRLLLQDSFSHAGCEVRGYK